MNVTINASATNATNNLNLCDLNPIDFLRDCDPGRHLIWFLLFVFQVFLVGAIIGFIYFYITLVRPLRRLQRNSWRDWRYPLSDDEEDDNNDDDSVLDRADSVDELEYLYIEEELVDFGIVRMQSGAKLQPEQHAIDPGSKQHQKLKWTVDDVEKRLETLLRRYRRQATEIELRLSELRASNGYHGCSSRNSGSEDSAKIDLVVPESELTHVPFNQERDQCDKTAIDVGALSQRSKYVFEGKQECYVCMEECVTRTDCGCKAPVHIECLAHIRTLNKCTICQTGWLSLNKELALDDSENVTMVNRVNEMQTKRYYSYVGSSS